MRVLIADDHRLTLQGIRRALEQVDDIEVVGEAWNGSQVMPMIAQTNPDLVLLDIRMPQLDGLACLDRIKKRYPALKVVAISMYSDKEHIDAALRRGACGYIVKSINPSDLPSAIRQAVEGNFYYVATPEAKDEDVVRERRGADGQAVPDPQGRRTRALERGDRQGVVAQRADRQVPPPQGLPQARARKPHRGRPLGIRARARRVLALTSNRTGGTCTPFGRRPGAANVICCHACRRAPTRPSCDCCARSA